MFTLSDLKHADRITFAANGEQRTGYVHGYRVMHIGANKPVFRVETTAGNFICGWNGEGVTYSDDQEYVILHNGWPIRCDRYFDMPGQMFYQGCIGLIEARIKAGADGDHEQWKGLRNLTEGCREKNPAIYAEAVRTVYIRQETAEGVTDAPKFNDQEWDYWLGLPPHCRQCHEAPALVNGLCADCYADNRFFARP